MQIDLLERFAHRHGAIPLYCLYNFSDHVDPQIHWHCCQRPFQVEQLGCTVTASLNVRLSINKWGTRNLSDIHKYQNTIPWRCLAMCPNIQSFLAPGFRELPLDTQADVPDMMRVQPRLYTDIPPR